MGSPGSYIFVSTMKRWAFSVFLSLQFLALGLDHFSLAEGGDPMTVTSPNFKLNGFIPRKYTCQGDDINPELAIHNIPPEAKSLVLVMDDPDAPMGTWVHWVIYDMDVASAIPEHSVPGREGMNSFGRKRYGGPCPPSGTHRYFFKVYALDAKLNLQDPVVDKARVEKAMKGHILAQAELIGLYKRQ